MMLLYWSTMPISTNMLSTSSSGICVSKTESSILCKSSTMSRSLHKTIAVGSLKSPLFSVSSQRTPSDSTSGNSILLVSTSTWRKRSLVSGLENPLWKDESSWRHALTHLHPKNSRLCKTIVSQRLSRDNQLYRITNRSACKHACIRHSALWHASQERKRELYLPLVYKGLVPRLGIDLHIIKKNAIAPRQNPHWRNTVRVLSRMSHRQASSRLNNSSFCLWLGRLKATMEVVCPESCDPALFHLCCGFCMLNQHFCAAPEYIIGLDKPSKAF